MASSGKEKERQHSSRCCQHPFPNPARSSGSEGKKRGASRVRRTSHLIGQEPDGDVRVPRAGTRNSASLMNPSCSEISYKARGLRGRLKKRSLDREFLEI